MTDKRKYADDWKKITESEEVYYSKKLDLYYYNGKHYDERSALHNGIIGSGRLLAELIKRNLT